MNFLDLPARVVWSILAVLGVPTHNTAGTFLQHAIDAFFSLQTRSEPSSWIRLATDPAVERARWHRSPRHQRPRQRRRQKNTQTGARAAIPGQFFPTLTSFYTTEWQGTGKLDKSSERF